ncbi:MAG: hypothetical protein ACPLSJ_00980 [Thermosulfidibacteraceae bacterium]|mgnify:FL=1
MKGGVKFVLRKNTFIDVCLELSKDAAIVIIGKNCLRTQRIWREEIVKKVNCSVYRVESDVVVPTDVVSKNRYIMPIFIERGYK